MDKNAVITGLTNEINTLVGAGSVSPAPLDVGNLASRLADIVAGDESIAQQFIADQKQNATVQESVKLGVSVPTAQRLGF